MGKLQIGELCVFHKKEVGHCLFLFCGVRYCVIIGTEYSMNLHINYTIQDLKEMQLYELYFQ